MQKVSRSKQSRINVYGFDKLNQCEWVETDNDLHYFYHSQEPKTLGWACAMHYCDQIKCKMRSRSFIWSPFDLIERIKTRDGRRLRS